MKKLIVLLVALICVMPVMGCASTADGNITQNSVGNDKVNDVVQADWGIKLETENVTPGGLTLVCHQSGGENVSDLQTGSYFVIQKLEKTGWADVESIPRDNDIVWTSEAWVIQKEKSTTWKVKWNFIYGDLPDGKYRIGKEIMNFREAGDFDTEIIYAEFEIKNN